MPEIELPDNDTDPSNDDGAGDGDPQAVTLETLQAEVASLRAAQTKQVTDFTAAVGRYQSLEARVAARGGDADVLVELRSRQEAMDEALKAVLDDETVSPAIKARAQAAFDKQTAAAATARDTAQQKRIEALETAQRGGASGGAQAAAVSPFERGVLTAIEAADLDPDDPAFDWAGKASEAVLKGEAAGLAYFKAKIKELVAARDGRQTRKEAAGTAKGGTASGGNKGALDASRPVEDRLKHLQTLGVI